LKNPVGRTPTEKYLSELCDRTFLKLWSYANPFNSDGKELCDVLAVFENHVFLFFDRESRKFGSTERNIALTWERWKREAIDKQIRTAAGAKNYVERHRKEIYLDAKCTKPFPIAVPQGEIKIHKIIIAHGAAEACKNFSDQNVYGSLGICYGSSWDGSPSTPFIVHLDKADPVHIFDSHNLEIVLSELDTFFDFEAYLNAKERAIVELDFFGYCGEEDLLAHYLFNFDSDTKRHRIGIKDQTIMA
jgi:hypothetical protein